jgi:hypothetical protein
MEMKANKSTTYPKHKHGSKLQVFGIKIVAFYPNKLVYEVSKNNLNWKFKAGTSSNTLVLMDLYA